MVTIWALQDIQWKFWAVACKYQVHSHLSDLLFLIGYFWWCLFFYYYYYFPLLCRKTRYLHFSSLVRESMGEDWEPGWEVLLAASSNDRALKVDYQLKLLSCFCPCVGFQSTLGLQRWRCVNTAECPQGCQIPSYCNEALCLQSVLWHQRVTQILKTA